ncbi:hypothetical protein GBA52_024550, partial [Prunus armeniaca]
VVPKTGDDNRCFQHDPAKPYIGPDFTYDFAVFEKGDPDKLEIYCFVYFGLFFTE